MFASSEGHTEVVKVLVEAKADLNITNQVNLIISYLLHSLLCIRGVGRISDMGGGKLYLYSVEKFSYRKSRPLIKWPLTPNPFTD